MEIAYKIYQAVNVGLFLFTTTLVVGYIILNYFKK